MLLCVARNVLMYDNVCRLKHSEGNVGEALKIFLDENYSFFGVISFDILCCTYILKKTIEIEIFFFEITILD